MSLFSLAILAVVVESSAVYTSSAGTCRHAADAAALAARRSWMVTNAGFRCRTLEAAAYAEDMSKISRVSMPFHGGHRAIKVEVRKKAATAFAGWLSSASRWSARSDRPDCLAAATRPGVVPLAIDLATYNSCIADESARRHAEGVQPEQRTHAAQLRLPRPGRQGGGQLKSATSAWWFHGCHHRPGSSGAGQQDGMRECLHDRMTACCDDSDGIRCLTIEDVLMLPALRVRVQSAWWCSRAPIPTI